MAELTEYEKESYNIYIGEGLKSDVAEKLATGELSAADYKELQNKKPVDTEESIISNAGYNVELIDKTKKEVKENNLAL